MKKILHFKLNLSLLVTFLLSCTPIVSEKEAKYSAGPKPTNIEAVQMVKGFLQNNLKISNPTELKITEPSPGIITTGSIKFKREGWVICYSAKKTVFEPYNTRYRPNYSHSHNQQQRTEIVKGYVGVYNEKIADPGNIPWAENYCKQARWIKENSYSGRGFFGSVF